MDILDAIDKINDSIFEGVGSGIGGVSGFVNHVIPYCSLLATIIMIILVGTKVINYFMNPSGNMDPFILVKPILVLAAIVLYQPLVELLLVKPVNLVTDITESAAMQTVNITSMDNFLDIVDAQLSNVQDAATGGNGTVSIYDILQLSTFLEIIHLLIQFVALVVTGYILLRQVLLKAIYFILGVFVLPLSLIPSNFEILKNWFFGFLSVLLWIPILRIFQTLIVLIHQAPIDGGFTQPLYSVVLQVVMILFLIQVPKYANFLVNGSGDNDGNGYLFWTGREIYQKMSSRRSNRNNNDNK
ncbi:hypothetical protein A8C32_18165 [Flavivirga aquatica]|uniref:Conjugative transposon protein TraJ n=1 Tax=Flavivirga aquatica TaxID=1849968 RepID=A0A1E5T7K8_9FLAO|nr:hypothetical protein [Flavivirga aquatica]OEK07362.1 hypothetical protein A8C32_18165 [Flavivirga aquatica]